ncbi:MAG: zinc ABC transporter substrate-binding protein [Pseudomonadota bacterium]|nr:zinc ABC transporter substrate-binding protein [Pseudomonadota bacterium]
MILNTAQATVIVTLKPIHALVSGVMADLGQPQLLLSGSETPHTFSLRPSQVKQLHQAELIVWVGPHLEHFLKKVLTTLNDKVTVLTLIEVEALTRLTRRAGGIWAQASTTESALDPHIWLNPQNAQIIVKAIAQSLSQVDPQHQHHYQHNSAQLLHQLEQLDQALQQQLKAVQDRPFLVFHDAYQYFEKHYQLNALGALQVSSEQKPGAQRLYQLRQMIQQSAISCVFKEPQFNNTLAQTVVEDSAARIATLDPLGIELEAGSQAYFELLKNLARSLTQCLKGVD